MAYQFSRPQKGYRGVHDVIPGSPLAGWSAYDDIDKPRGGDIPAGTAIPNNNHPTPTADSSPALNEKPGHETDAGRIIADVARALGSIDTLIHKPHLL